MTKTSHTKNKLMKKLVPSKNCHMKTITETSSNKNENQDTTKSTGYIKQQWNKLCCLKREEWIIKLLTNTSITISSQNSYPESFFRYFCSGIEIILEFCKDYNENTKYKFETYWRYQLYQLFEEWRVIFIWYVFW